MKILICNERFLFRFGADRVLIILGKKLKDLGHTISIMANQYDKEIVETFAEEIIEVPEQDNNYIDSNEYTATWLKNSWNDHFYEINSPDIILIGGWPFFSSIPFLRQLCRNVIFIDFGAVPLDGYCGGPLIIQEKLRAMRKRYLKDVTLIIAISNFIANTQSMLDTNDEIPTRVILLGADHMNMSLWSIDKLNVGKLNSDVIERMRQLRNKGTKQILCLGRWEPNCYKNSEASFDILRQILTAVPNCVMFILANPSSIEIPDDLRGRVIPIGFPDDDELANVMKGVDLGLSVSLWEGFNLPIVEMQWLSIPVLAFDVGAHPEVIAHPWYLCQDKDEMGLKSVEILTGKGLASETKREALDKFHDYFKWERTVSEYRKVFDELFLEIINNYTLIIDVTNAARDAANSGVIRVTRRLSREFQRHLNPIFVIWDQEHNQYILPTRQEFNQLSQYNGPIWSADCILSPEEHRITLNEILDAFKRDNIWLLLPETVNEKSASKIRRYARSNRIKLAAIFYDAIPVLYPELCKDKPVRVNHPHYMKGLAECDVVIPISNYSSRCLEKFWMDNNIKGCNLYPNILPGEFGGFKRIIEKKYINNKISILCVSTLEPRKNHKKLIEACLLMEKLHPELDWKLTLVGNRYAGAFEIARYVEETAAKNHRIEWLGVVDDLKLHSLYNESTFTVYPSFIEGFGMPILESVWHGTPCICHCEGVMAELAEDGGCLTCDVLDEIELSNAIYKLSSDETLLYKLSQEAINRKIKTWDEYTRAFLSMFNCKDCKSICEPDWQEILYPRCLCEKWQMNHSERLALTALLTRIQPRCSIEIGTYKGGSLSLISQYSKMVFSIDIDPKIPEFLNHFRNVCFLTGYSSQIFPMLLDELDNYNINIDFILIDGDHSAEGIRKDIECILAYVPRKSFFVAMHDSFNPECRRGILEAKWTKSPYVDWIDIDFIPGRLIEDTSPARGEMWGGLALAFFKPTVRDGPISINHSAEKMYDMLKKISRY